MWKVTKNCKNFNFINVQADKVTATETETEASGSQIFLRALASFVT